MPSQKSGQPPVSSVRNQAMTSTTRKEMVDWAFQQLLEGLCQGRSLHQIAGTIVDGIANMTE